MPRLRWKVDSKCSSVLCNEYIGEKKEKIGTIQGDLDSVTAELHTILAGVSDIFSTSASYATYESDISSNVVTAQSDMQQVITDMETFNTNHLLDCETISAALDDIIRVIDLAQGVFVDNQISSVTDEELLTALSSLDANITDMTTKIMEDPFDIASVINGMNITLTIYGTGVVLGELGISIADYRKLIKQGLQIRVVNDKGNVILKVISKNMSTGQIKNALSAMNIPHMTSESINKLAGNGLKVINDKGNVSYQHLLVALTDADGFKSVAGAINNGKLPTLVKGSKFKKFSTVIDGVGYGITGGVNLCDNCYDEKTGKWTLDGETITDTITDTATEIVIDQGIQAACAGIGTLICPGVGTAIGYVAGAVISLGASWIKFGEPPKTVVDNAKDIASDLTHSIADTFSNIFW